MRWLGEYVGQCMGRWWWMQWPFGLGEGKTLDGMLVYVLETERVRE